MERYSEDHEGLSVSPTKARKIRGLNKCSLRAVAAPSPAAVAGLSAAPSHCFGHTSYLLKIDFFLLGKDKNINKKPFF